MIEEDLRRASAKASYEKRKRDAKALAKEIGPIEVDMVLIQEAGFGYKLPVTDEDYCEYYTLDVSDHDASENSIGVVSCYELFDDQDGNSLYFGIGINNLIVRDGVVYAEYWY